MACLRTDGLLFWIPGLIILIVLILVSIFYKETADIFMIVSIIYGFFFFLLTGVWWNLDKYSTDSWAKGAKRFTDGVAQTAINSSFDESQVTVDLPILYQDDNSFMIMFYMVDSEKARAAIKADGKDYYLEPYVIFGKTLVLLVIFEYRATTVGTYNEVAVAVHCKRKGTNPSLIGFIWDLRKNINQALLVLNLPVNAEAAWKAGRAIWNYPKYVTDIDTTFEKGHFKAKLGNEFEISHTGNCGVTIGGLPFCTYTEKDGHLIHTKINVGHKVKYSGGSSVKITPGEDTEGPSITTMRTLGLLDKKPLCVCRTDSMTSILPEGTDMGKVTKSEEKKPLQS